MTDPNVPWTGEPRVRAGDPIALALTPDDGSRPKLSASELRAHQEV